MRYMYDRNPPISSSRIKVENIKADILMLAAKNDDFWPSDEAIPRMEAVLAGSNYPYRIKSIVYEKASHLLGNIPILNPFFKMMIRIGIEAERNYPKECLNARKDSVQQILSFLYEW